jgi:hypothetical protein
MNQILICEKVTFCLGENGELIISVDASVNLEEEGVVLDSTEVADLKVWLNTGQ